MEGVFNKKTKVCVQWPRFLSALERSVSVEYDTMGNCLLLQFS